MHLEELEEFNDTNVAEVAVSIDEFQRMFSVGAISKEERDELMQDVLESHVVKELAKDADAKIKLAKIALIVISLAKIL